MIKKILKENWPLIILILASFLTRFMFLNYPAEVVFDEVHFGKFVSSYFTHQYYFDIHPPLGKLMIAGFAEVFKFQPVLDFSQIGTGFANDNFLLLRFLPALFGSLLVVLIYLLVLKMGFSKRAAFLAGFLVLFDNGVLTQSKFILVDIFLLFFGFLALYFFLSYSQSPRRYLYLALSSIFAALAFSIKWTALSFLAVIILYDLFIFLKSKNLKRLLIELAVLVVIPILIYFSIFLIHFNILYKQGSGVGYMSPDFEKETSLQKSVELNVKMYQYNSKVTSSHPYGSLWYQWPFGEKPIWYWSKQAGDKAANIYFMANPLVWLSILITIPFFIFALAIKKIRKKIPLITYFLVLGYFINLLPFIFIKRVTFLYHYLPSLIFGIMITAIFVDYFFSENIFSKNKLKIIYIGYLAAVFLMFIFLSPLTYGFPISLKLNQIYSLFLRFFS